MTTRREELFASGVQFGHQCRSWCPKMAPFIWGKKDSIHLINVAATEIQIQKAEQLLENIATQGLPILWVGTKKVARRIVTKLAEETSSPYFADRWIGGALTNYHEVKKAVTNLLYNREILQKSDRQLYTKKELSTLQKKIERADKSVGGIQKLSWPIGALIVADVQKDYVAIKEATRMGIPVIALVDTNCDPEGIAVVIPCNDDLERAISTVFTYLADAIKRGKEIFAKNNPVGAALQNVEEANQVSRKNNRHENRHVGNKQDIGRRKDEGKGHGGATQDRKQAFQTGSGARKDVEKVFEQAEKPQVVQEEQSAEKLTPSGVEAHSSELVEPKTAASSVKPQRKEAQVKAKADIVKTEVLAEKAEESEEAAENTKKKVAVKSAVIAPRRKSSSESSKKTAATTTAASKKTPAASKKKETSKK